MNELIVGYDAGNNNAKVVWENGMFIFSSEIGEYRELKLGEANGENDFVFEYQDRKGRDRKGFAGELAERESEFGGSIMGDSKNHEDTLIRTLIGLHRIKASVNTFRVVMGQPISKHTEAEKKGIKDMLEGSHRFTLNGKTKVLKIESVDVAAEGGAAFWSAATHGLVRIVDLGSATVNYATLKDKRYVDKDSGTLPFGMNTVSSRNMGDIARGIATKLSRKWNKDDLVYVVGGVAEELSLYLQQYYPLAQPLPCKFNERTIDPIYANAIGFYNIGKGIYGDKNG